MKYLKLFLLSQVMHLFVSAQGHAEPIPDISNAFHLKDAALLMDAPAFYKDKEKAQLYHVLPKSFRVLETNGAPLKSVVRLANGRLIISARLGPWPRDFQSDPNYKKIVAKIRDEDPAAAFLSPTFKSPSVKLLGPVAGFVESITVTGSTSGTSESYLIIKVAPQNAAKFLEDLKRPLGILGSIEFKVKAFNGIQDLNWPVTFSWHLGELTVPNP